MACGTGFPTLMLANHAPLKDVQEILGHARPSHTLNLYWQSVPGASARVAGKAHEVLFGAAADPEAPQPPAARLRLVTPEAETEDRARRSATARRRVARRPSD